MIRRLPVHSGIVEVADEGTPAGECVVLLHGFLGSRESWSELRAALAGERRVVSVDLPGHGGTRVGAGSFSMEGAAAAAIEALEALGIRGFDLVGYSMGGRLALYLAVTRAERVARLVLESASAGLADASERAVRRAADEERAARIEREGVEAFVMYWERLPLFASLADLPPERRERLRRLRLSCDPAGLAASLRGMGTGVQPWLGEQLGKLRMPVLVVAGSRDARFAAIARELATSIPQARLAIVGNAGHVPH
ncbi:MAG: 2-succinyl-6-hydroxy-2,4-cyclohexadiene-1-carboxylate synthase, partial [Candidatus Binatia bacterium]